MILWCVVWRGEDEEIRRRKKKRKDLNRNSITTFTGGNGREDAPSTRAQQEEFSLSPAGAADGWQKEKEIKRGKERMCLNSGEREKPTIDLLKNYIFKN